METTGLQAQSGLPFGQTVRSITRARIWAGTSTPHSLGVPRRVQTTVGNTLGAGIDHPMVRSVLTALKAKSPWRDRRTAPARQMNHQDAQDTKRFDETWPHGGVKIQRMPAASQETCPRTIPGAAVARRAGGRMRGLCRPAMSWAHCRSAGPLRARELMRAKPRVSEKPARRLRSADPFRSAQAGIMSRSSRPRFATSDCSGQTAR